MSKLQNFTTFGLVLVVCLGVSSISAEPEPTPEPAKGHHRSAYFNEPANPKFRSVPLPDDVEEHLIAELRQADDEAVANEDDSNANKGDSSSGRLFMKKFLLFKNIFGNNQQQPVIPIIITGGNAGGTTSPTSTVTSTGTIPTATGTITTSPIAPRDHPEDEGEDGEGSQEGVEGVDVQALQAALAGAAQEYVVTDQEIKGTSDSKATRQESINLRRKGARKGQVIQVRIPPQYRRYFKNGQKVMLNTGNRQPNRRVVKKRVNKNRRRVNNKNKRNRLVPIA